MSLLHRRRPDTDLDGWPAVLAATTSDLGPPEPELGDLWIEHMLADEEDWQRALERLFTDGGEQAS